MALTPGNVTMLNAVTTTQTSSAASTGDLGEIYVEIVVVGTPSVAASIIPQFSPDGTKYYNGPTYTTPLAAGTWPFIINVPPGCVNAKVAFTAQTGGTSSTCTAQLGKKTFP